MIKKIILDNKIGEVVDASRPNYIAQAIARMNKKQNQNKYRFHLVKIF